MKKTIIYSAFALMAMSSFLSSCESNTKKVEDKEENVEEAKEELKEAQTELNAEYPALKTEAEEKFAANEKRIGELRAKVDKNDKDALDGMRSKRIDELEQQNADLRRRLNAYETDRSDWETFKREFNHDMDGMGKAFEDVGKDNKN